LKELLLRLNRTLWGQFLREICPFKKMTPKFGRNITAIARKLLKNLGHRAPPRRIQKKTVSLGTRHKNSLYATLFAPRTIQYWECHHELKIDPNHPVDWEPSRMAMKKLPKATEDGWSNNYRAT
jgi:hypothetical protein